MTELPPALMDELAESLPSEIGRDFLHRNWSTPLSTYAARIEALGFTGRERVLDAGSGFGHWSVVLAERNQVVLGLDRDDACVAVASRIAEHFGLANLSFRRGSIEELPFAAESFDTVFSYSVIYFTDYRASLREFHRVLTADGLCYINTNDLGWYVSNIIEERHKTRDYFPRQMAIDTLRNSIRYFATGEYDPAARLVMPKSIVLAELEALGFEVLASGPDASINCTNANGVQAFYPAQYYGECGIYEVLCRKR